jgi:tRNA-splicing ligase RtcB (3'-phosphate/5'-hydroxy nucleic acid ligase)
VSSTVCALTSKCLKTLFEHLPVGVGVDGSIRITREDLNRILDEGIDWAIEKGYAWPEDKLCCEEEGRMTSADRRCVSQKALHRGLTQVSSLLCFVPLRGVR